MLESVLGLFVLGTIGFWIVSGLWFCLLIALTENDHDWWAAITLVAFGVLLYFGNTGALSNITIGSIAMTVLYYFLIGAGWSVGKWYFFVNKKAREVMNHKRAWMKRTEVKAQQEENPFTIDDPIPTVALKEAFKEYLLKQRYMSYGQDSIIPSAGENKDKLVRWIIWWPLSATWTILNDPIRRLATKIYEALQRVYTAISNHAFKNVHVE